MKAFLSRDICLASYHVRGLLRLSLAVIAEKYNLLYVAAFIVKRLCSRRGLDTQLVVHAVLRTSWVDTLRVGPQPAVPGNVTKEVVVLR